MRTFNLTMIALAVALGAASSAYGQRPEGRGPAGGFNRGAAGRGDLFLLSQKSVQQDLKLTDDQVKKVEEQAAKQREGFAGLRDLSREQRQQRMQERAKAAQDAVAGILNADQLKRLEQISLQQRGARALNDPDVAEKLRLTGEQKDKLRSINQAAQSEMRDAFQGGGGNREEARKKFEELRKSTDEKLQAVLTAEQKTKLKELTGDEFKGEITRPQFRPGQGGPRERGNRGRGNREGGDRPRGNRTSMLDLQQAAPLFLLTSYLAADEEAKAGASEQTTADKQDEKAGEKKDAKAESRKGKHRHHARHHRGHRGHGSAHHRGHGRGGAHARHHRSRGHFAHGKRSPRDLAWAQVARRMSHRGHGPGGRYAMAGRYPRGLHGFAGWNRPYGRGPSFAHHRGHGAFGHRSFGHGSFGHGSFGHDRAAFARAYARHAHGLRHWGVGTHSRRFDFHMARHHGRHGHRPMWAGGRGFEGRQFAFAHRGHHGRGHHMDRGRHQFSRNAWAHRGPSEWRSHAFAHQGKPGHGPRMAGQHFGRPGDEHRLSDRPHGPSPGHRMASHHGHGDFHPKASWAKHRGHGPGKEKSREMKNRERAQDKKPAGEKKAETKPAAKPDEQK